MPVGWTLAHADLQAIALDICQNQKRTFLGIKMLQASRRLLEGAVEMGSLQRRPSYQLCHIDQYPITRIYFEIRCTFFSRTDNHGRYRQIHLAVRPGTHHVSPNALTLCG